MFTTEGQAIIATGIIFGILSGVSVVLRIYAQTLKKRPGKRSLRTGDYFMIAAWVRNGSSNGLIVDSNVMPNRCSQQRW